MSSLIQTAPQLSSQSPSTSTFFANKVVATIITSLSGQLSEADLIFKHELLNGILKLFMEQGVSLFKNASSYDFSYHEASLYGSQVDLLLTKIGSENLGVLILQYLISEDTSVISNKKVAELVAETHFSLLYVFRAVSVMGIGFTGISNKL
jgi:hypothetical protein